MSRKHERNGDRNERVSGGGGCVRNELAEKEGETWSVRGERKERRMEWER